MNKSLVCIDVYTVSEGDTLYAIAEKYDLPVSSVWAIASGLFHGQIFTRLPIMKPARMIRTCLCQRERSQCRSFEKLRIPTTAPMANTPIINKLPTTS